MATNPMQRKSRNSFLLGMVVMLLIAAVVVALLYMKINSLQEKLEEYQDNEVTQSVYVLNQDVKSGQVLETSMFTLKKIAATMIPTNATTDIISALALYSLRDTDGNPIYYGTDDGSNYYYIKINNTNCTIYVTNSAGQEEIATSLTTEDTAYYYEGNNKNNSNKKNITIASNAVVAKVDLTANTVITSSLIVRSDEVQTDDIREQEYNMLVLPTELVSGDYVDVRLMLPNGQDFIVVAKKQVSIPEAAGEYMADTITMNLTEDEILTMSSAIVEAYRIDGSKLYVTKYTEPGTQVAATPNYPVNSDVLREIDQDPNVLETAKNALINRYSSDMRNIIEQQETNEDNIQTKMEESIQTTQDNRKEYLDSLISSATQTTTTTTN